MCLTFLDWKRKPRGHIKCWYIIIILHIYPEVLQHRWLNGSPQDESRTPRERRPVGGCRPNPILLDSLQVKHTRKTVLLNVIFFYMLTLTFQLAIVHFAGNQPTSFASKSSPSKTWCYSSSQSPLASKVNPSRKHQPRHMILRQQGDSSKANSLGTRWDTATMGHLSRKTDFS